MRIISGEVGGIRLHSLKGESTRPTSDKVKESLFNKIGPYIDGGIVVDLFGGSGALALEALSRGADYAYIFERDRRAVDVIRRNVEKCKMQSRVTIVPKRAETSVRYLQERDIRATYLFIDPPYEDVKQYEIIQKFVELDRLCHNATIVCEHMRSVQLREAYGRYTLQDYRAYGASAISIYME